MPEIRETESLPDTLDLEIHLFDRMEILVNGGPGLGS